MLASPRRAIESCSCGQACAPCTLHEPHSIIELHLCHLDTPLRTYPRLARLTNLQALDLSFTPFASTCREILAPMASLQSLTCLNLSHCRLTSLDGVEALSHLTQLKCHRNSLTSLADVVQLHELEELWASSNSLPDFELARLRDASAHLSNVLLSDNPCSSHPSYRMLVIGWLQPASIVDGTRVTLVERANAASYFHSRNGRAVTHPLLCRLEACSRTSLSRASSMAVHVHCKRPSRRGTPNSDAVTGDLGPPQVKVCPVDSCGDVERAASSVVAPFSTPETAGDGLYSGEEAISCEEQIAAAASPSGHEEGVLARDIVSAGSRAGVTSPSRLSSIASVIIERVAYYKQPYRGITIESLVHRSDKSGFAAWPNGAKAITADVSPGILTVAAHYSNGKLAFTGTFMDRDMDQHRCALSAMSVHGKTVLSSSGDGSYLLFNRDGFVRETWNAAKSQDLRLHLCDGLEVAIVSRRAPPQRKGRLAEDIQLPFNGGINKGDDAASCTYSVEHGWTVVEPGMPSSGPLSQAGKGPIK
ncbi:unnamed protein product [Chrysoparadoxa australica]